jgi:hypothetical protein
MAPSRIPYPDRGQGISFFLCLLPLLSSVSGPGVSFLKVGKAESRGVEAGFRCCCPGSFGWTAAIRFWRPRCSRTEGSVDCGVHRQCGRLVH